MHSFYKKKFKQRVIFLILITFFTSCIGYYMMARDVNLYAQFIDSPVTSQILSQIKVPVNAATKEYPLLKAIWFDPSDPLKMKFYLDKMDFSQICKADLERVIKYFLGFLSIPQENLWVNLSPYENDKIIPDSLAQLDVGKTLLLEDYLLKQISSSLTNPTTSQGKKFWQKVYVAAQQIAGTTKVPINNFYKVWIVPDVAEVYEYRSGREEIHPSVTGKVTAFVKNAKLKVILETDYHNNVKQQGKGLSPVPNRSNHIIQGTTAAKIQEINNAAKEIFKKELLPIIENQVNHGEQFAPLRQMYQALILALYFKDKLKDHFFYKHYINQLKVSPIELNEPNLKSNVYQAYCNIFQKGVYNLVNNEKDAYLRKGVKRKYFSGGFNFGVTEAGQPLLPKVFSSFNPDVVKNIFSRVQEFPVRFSGLKPQVNSELKFYSGGKIFDFLYRLAQRFSAKKGQIIKERLINERQKEQRLIKKFAKELLKEILTVPLSEERKKLLLKRLSAIKNTHGKIISQRIFDSFHEELKLKEITQRFPYALRRLPETIAFTQRELTDYNIEIVLAHKFKLRIAFENNQFILSARVPSERNKLVAEKVVLNDYSRVIVGNQKGKDKVVSGEYKISFYDVDTNSALLSQHLSLSVEKGKLIISQDQQADKTEYLALCRVSDKQASGLFQGFSRLLKSLSEQKDANATDQEGSFFAELNSCNSPLLNKCFSQVVDKIENPQNSDVSGKEFLIAAEYLRKFFEPYGIIFWSVKQDSYVLGVEQGMLTIDLKDYPQIEKVVYLFPSVEKNMSRGFTSPVTHDSVYVLLSDSNENLFSAEINYAADHELHHNFDILAGIFPKRDNLISAYLEYVAYLKGIVGVSDVSGLFARFFQHNLVNQFNIEQIISILKRNYTEVSEHFTAEGWLMLALSKKIQEKKGVIVKMPSYQEILRINEKERQDLFIKTSNNFIQFFSKNNGLLQEIAKELLVDFYQNGDRAFMPESERTFMGLGYVPKYVTQARYFVRSHSLKFRKTAVSFPSFPIFSFKNKDDSVGGIALDKFKPQVTQVSKEIKTDILTDYQEILLKENLDLDTFTGIYYTIDN